MRLNHIFKSAFALLLAVLMLTAFFSGCSGDKDLPSESETDSESVYTEAPSEETESSAEDASSEPTEPSTKPTEPSTKPTEPSAKPAEPSTKPTEPSPKPPVSAVSPQMEQVLSIVNKERAAAGLSPLVFDADLNAAAAIRAKEIQILFDHKRPDGSLCFTVSDKAYGENIAFGQPTADAVMNSWMNSEGHRNNILKPKYKTIGIGYAVDKNGTAHWVQLFGF